MSFGGGGFFGSGAKQSSSSSVTNTTNIQETLQGGDNGVSVLGDGNQIVYSDFNAIDKATSLAESAVQGGFENSRRAFNLASEFAETSTDFVSSATSFAQDALISNQNFLTRSAERESTTLGTVLEGLFDYTRQSQESLGSTVSAINAIGVERNTSADQRLSETTQTLTKYALVALVVLGGIFMMSRYK